VCVPLVEEVAAERHALPDGAAKEIADGTAGQVALDVEAGHLEGGVDGVERRVHVEHAAEAGARAAAAGREHPGDQQAEPCQVVGVMSEEVAGDSLQPGQVGLVRVRLAEAEQAVIGVKLDDRPKRMGLVDPHHVEQRRILEGDRGYLNP
jgi:hypothetical protein